MTEASTIAARLGVVSYLNTLPLIDGLEKAEDVEVVAAVPSSLAGLLAVGATDLSLCSVIDQQRSKVPLELVPVGPEDFLKVMDEPPPGPAIGGTEYGFGGDRGGALRRHRYGLD